MMDEYIKREDAIKAITWNGISEPPEIISLTLLTAKKNIRNIQTADVVPKSEVEGMTVELDAMRGAANSYKMHYENLARNIFAEIEKCRVVGVDGVCGFLIYDIHALRKKYTEENT